MRDWRQALVFEVALDTLVNGHEVREGVLPLRVLEVEKRVLKIGLDIKAYLKVGVISAVRVHQSLMGSQPIIINILVEHGSNQL